jgi:ribosomal protein L29
MKINEIRKLNTNDLTLKSNELKQDIVSLRRKVSLGEVSNVRLVKQRRKDLARVLTVLGENLQKEAK